MPRADVPSGLQTPASARTLQEALRKPTQADVKLRVTNLLAELGRHESAMERLIEQGRDFNTANQHLATARDHTRNVAAQQQRDIDLLPRLEQQLMQARAASENAYQRWDHVSGRDSASYDSSVANADYEASDQVVREAEAAIPPVLTRLQTFDRRFESAKRIELMAERTVAAARRETGKAEQRINDARQRLATVAEDIDPAAMNAGIERARQPARGTA